MFVKFSCYQKIFYEKCKRTMGNTRVRFVTW